MNVESPIYFSLFMEGVPFVGNDACAHNLLLKGRPLIMRLRQASPPHSTSEPFGLTRQRVTANSKVARRRDRLAEAHATLEHISGRLDVFDAQVDLCLAAVVGSVREGPAKHFDSGGLPSLSDVQHLVELRRRYRRKLLGTPVKGIVEKLDDRLFVEAGGYRQRFDVGHVGKSF